MTTINKREINYNNCLSVKNKKKNTVEQCNHKRLKGCEFCGIHNRAKNKIKVTELYTVYNVDGDTYKKIMKIDDQKVVPTIYYTKEFLLEGEKGQTEEQLDNCEFKNIDKVQVTKLRNTVKHYELTKMVCKNQSKRNIYNELIKYLRKEKKYLDNIEKIIKIQKVFRGYDVYRRASSINSTECNSFISIYDIPTNYYYYLIENNKKYSFDFRSIYSIINSEFPCNPYTMSKFGNDLIDKIKYDAISRMTRFKQDWFFKQEEMTEDEKIREYALETFHKIDMLGNYTDFNWILELHIFSLKDLYKRTKDMFDYRINLSNVEKQKYVENGIAFGKSTQFVDNVNSKNGVIRIILDEYNRFLDYSSNIEDKKTAILWLLSSLVEISHNARIALPHLDQGLFEMV
jgi:hypothetical protein